MSVYLRSCKRKECKGKQCRHKHFHYRFGLNGVKYRGAIPEARTRWDAEQAEAKIRRNIFEGKYGTPASGKGNLGEFIEKDYLPHAKANKRSFKNDDSRSKVVIVRFGNRSFRDITPEMIEKFKCDLAGSITRRGTKRSQADVNRHLEFLSAVFELAIQYRRVSLNPCRQVKRFKPDNERTRHLLPEEEETLLQKLTGRLKHLKPLVIMALGTGLRKRELLDLRRDQVDFSRSLVIASHTKGKRNREIPMDTQVRDVLWKACRGRGMNDYVFPNPQTGKPYTDIKHSFDTACANAGIEGLWWHDLRATFATRLGADGHDIRTIMDLMGHQDPKTCLRYVRATEPAKRAAVQSAFIRPGHKMDTRRLVAV
jgi:integrase